MKFSVKALSFLMMYLVSSMFLVVKDGTVTLVYAELIADDTIEIIEVSGKRTPRPNYNLFIVDMRTFAQMAGWGSTEAEDIYYEEMRKMNESDLKTATGETLPVYLLMVAQFLHFFVLFTLSR